MSTLTKSVSVLIVEDDNLVAQDIALRLSALGYGVAGILSSGEEALQQYARLKVDLVLMDIMLAGSMDGIETARQIQLTTNIPVVYLTSYADHELLTRALTTRPFAYLQKPLKERELELTLELALLRHRLEAQSLIDSQALEYQVSARTQALDSTRQTLQQLQYQQRDQISLQRFSDALDDSADSIFLIDRNSMRFIDANRTACEELGYSKRELLQMGPHDIKPYFNRQMLEQEFDNIAASPARFGIIDTFHKRKNNELFPIEIRLRATESEGRATIVAVARDMTLRDQAEEALRQSEEQFRQISQNLQHVLWIRDAETEQVIYISKAYEAIWGRAVEQVYRRPRMLFADIHPEDRERITATVQRMWKDRHEMDEEYRLLRSDGQTRWLWTRTFPIRNPEGKVYRIGGVTEDITARKEEEGKLRFSEEKFRNLFENSPIGLALVATDYYLHDVNPAFCGMLGYSKEELARKTFMDITHPDDIQADLELGKQLLSGEISNYSLEKRYLTRQGEPLWIKLHGAIIRDHHEKPLFGLGMIENIDDIKRAETLRLAREAAQKIALVREVHHRIKNHLQGVTGLMYQNAMNNSLCSKVIEEAIAQINVVATIHGLQAKESGEDIDLLQMIRAIFDALKEFNPARFTSPISVTGELALYLNRNESVPVALSLNELMVNAAKHGSGPMEISLQRSGEHAIIRIENPCGQTATQSPAGSGLELVHALLQSEAISFSHVHDKQRFMAEITLIPPVIQLHRNPQ